MLVLFSCWLQGCSVAATNTPSSQEDAYCLSGSKENDYSCETGATADIEPTVATPSATQHTDVDEVWMYTKLAEVRAWLTQQKQFSAAEASADNLNWQTLQLGSFRQSDNASKLQNQLLAKGYATFSRHRGDLTIVYVGRETNPYHLEIMQSVLLEEFNLFGRIVDFPDQ
ncbi:SPOR domain-containing protein [Pontibacter sp. JAM-7]|uniref:SPOR domain-containing protein n=1 Tax=Pontibacter sp. JAM-7 TaxID=3366581 RepID=UPI003AF78893